jgi:hypothetical protein
MQTPTSSALPIAQRKVVFMFVPMLLLMLPVLARTTWVATALRGLFSHPAAAVRSSDKVAPRIRVLHFTLTPLGLNPSAATIPEGRYVIEITNRSELSEFSLNLGRLSGHKQKEVKAIRKHGEWSGVFDLKRDNFVLAINEKPEWTANIQVTKEDNR